MKFKSVLISSISIFTVVFISFATGTSFAHEGCEVWAIEEKNHQEINPCMVMIEQFDAYNGKMEKYSDDFKMECTLDKNIQDIMDDNGYCKIWDHGKDASMIVFQPRGIRDGSPRKSEITVDHTIHISLKDDQRLIISGAYLPWQNGLSPFHIWCGDNVGGATRYCPRARLAYEELATDRTVLNIENIPAGEAAFDISGRGTVIFRNIDIRSKCIDLTDGDPTNDDKNCGHPVRVRDGAKVVFDSSDVLIGLGYRALVEVKDGNEALKGRVAFKESNVDYDREPFTKINSRAVSLFSSDSSRLIRASNFDNVKFEHIGAKIMITNPDGTIIPSPDNYFWNGYHPFMDAPLQPRVKCKMDTLNSCVIDSDFNLLKYEDSFGGGYNEFLNTDIPAEEVEDVLFIKKDGDDIDFSNVGIEFDVIRADAVRLKLPEGFIVGSSHLMTNYGQPIDVVLHKCPDGRPLINEDENYTCPAPDGAVFDGDTWTFSCLDTSATYDVYNNECVCPDNKVLVDGVCKYNFDSIINNNITVDAATFLESDADTDSDVDDDTLPLVDEDPIVEDDIISEVDAVNIEEQKCLDNGGVWISDGLLGSKCEYKESDTDISDEIETKGSYSGCSLTVASKASSWNFWLVFLSLPMLMAWLRRK